MKLCSFCFAVAACCFVISFCGCRQWPTGNNTEPYTPSYSPSYGQSQPGGEGSSDNNRTATMQYEQTQYPTNSNQAGGGFGYPNSQYDGSSGR